MAHRSILESKEPDFSQLADLVKENNLEQIKKLIQQSKQTQDWNWYYSKEYYVPCAVRDAIIMGQIETVKLFLEAGFSADSLAFAKGYTGGLTSLVSFAAESGNLPIVKLLVENRADITSENSYFNTGDDSAIRAAVKTGHVEIANYLLENGATAKSVTDYGSRRLTFLAEAASQDNIPMMELLIKHGATIENSLELTEAKLNYELRLPSTNISDLKIAYQKPIKNIMQFAAGIDFSGEVSGYWPWESISGLTFLNDVDLTGVNFVGVSIAGRPVTRAILNSLNFKHVDKAIITISDLKNSKDSNVAIIKNQLEKQIQKQGELIDKNGIVNLVPLWRAADIGDEQAVTVRLNAGVDPNETGKDKQIPIVLAAQKGHITVVKLLVNHPKLNPASLVAAIRAAKTAEQLNIVTLLTSKQDIDQKDEKGNTQFYLAVQQGNVTEVKNLINARADVNLDGSDGQPLYVAASKCYDKEFFAQSSPSHIKIVKILLDAKADPNQSSFNTLPLDAAAACGSVDAMRLLMPVTHKTDRVKKQRIGLGSESKKIVFPWYQDMLFDSYLTPDWLEILKILKAEGDINFNLRKNGQTLLHLLMHDFPSLSHITSSLRGLALDIRGCEDRLPSDTLQSNKKYLVDKSIKTFLKRLALLDFLLDNGADPNAKTDGHGSTPLHIFMEHVDLGHIEGGYEGIIDRFLKKDFKLDTPDLYGQTLLHIAAKQGDLAAATYLLTKDANVNALDKHNRTPLFYAAAGNPETTKYLLAAGADTSIRDKDGNTAVEFSQNIFQEKISRQRFDSRKDRENFVLPYQLAQNAISSKASPPHFLQKLGIFSQLGDSKGDYKESKSVLNSQYVYVFLDIDGVLLSHSANPSLRASAKRKSQGIEFHSTLTTDECDTAALELFDAYAINLLKELFGRIENQENAKKVRIILSSNWRDKRDSIDELKKFFQVHPFIASRLFDKTAVLDTGRADEISQWLDSNRSKLNISEFLVIDDFDYDEGNALKNKFSEKFISVRGTELFAQDNLNDALKVL